MGEGLGRTTDPAHSALLSISCPENHLQLINIHIPSNRSVY